MNGSTPHIVQYQGSKRMLAPKILPYMPKHFSRLVEPFAGMAAISIAAAKQDRANSYVINDVNGAVVDILQMAIESPSKLYEEYRKVWLSQFDYPEGHVNHFYKIRDEYNNGDRSAAKMLYLIARCVKGSIRYDNNGKFNQSPDKRRNGTSPNTLKQNIEAISYFLKDRTSFFSVDYHDILDMTIPGDIVYLDPPYQGTSNVRDSRYISGVDFNDFVKAIEHLNKKNVDFIISYDGSCGDKQYGKELPKELELEKVLLNAGWSSQSILLGKRETTFEALYISRSLQQRTPVTHTFHPEHIQYSLFNPVTA